MAIYIVLIIQLYHNDEQIDRVESDSDEEDIEERVSHKEATEAFEIRVTSSLKPSSIVDYFKFYVAKTVLVFHGHVNIIIYII